MNKHTGQQAFVEALLDPESLPPAGLKTWNQSDPTARFAVYRNNVVASLIDALAATYPVTQELVGEDFFRAMARLFVQAELPQSRVLAFYGEPFPAFIAKFPPAQSVPYLADMARLEMLRVHAYHAADAFSMSANDIAQVLSDATSLPECIIGFHPAVRLLQSSYAVVSLWAAHQGLADITTIDPFVPENALVIRSHLDVEVISVGIGASVFIAYLLKGKCLGEAAEQTGELCPDFNLTTTLGLLIHHKIILSMALPPLRGH